MTKRNQDSFNQFREIPTYIDPELLVLRKTH